MTVTITPQLIILAASFIGAIVALSAYIARLVRWVDNQKKQDKAIAALRTHHDEDNSAIQKELAILVSCNLACLKGLKELGCNGPVSDGIEMIEKHINKEAHK